MDVETVLLSVQERDKWRHRSETLSASLREIRKRRDDLRRGLRRIERELRRLADYSEELLDESRARAMPRSHAPVGILRP